MKNKIFRVSIAQYCKPITVFAKDEDDARNKATEDQAILKAQEETTWEVHDAEFQAEEVSS